MVFIYAYFIQIICKQIYLTLIWDSNMHYYIDDLGVMAMNGNYILPLSFRIGPSLPDVIYGHSQDTDEW